MSWRKNTWRPAMQLYDGVFAVNKPSGITSADLCNDLKHKFTASEFFAPQMKKQLDVREASRRSGERRTKALRLSRQIKIGHGGTLDPEASGIMVVGIGEGTKALGHFQKGASKGYEAVVLFGAATDSFDCWGNVVGWKAWDGVTREKVEAELANFRGKIMQRPSVFSALSRGGVKMYDYARQGKEIPELEKREMFVEKLELVDWYEGGTHQYAWPTMEVLKDRKDTFVKALRIDEIGGVRVVEGRDGSSLDTGDTQQGKKRKRRYSGEQGGDTLISNDGSSNATAEADQAQSAEQAQSLWPAQSAEEAQPAGQDQPGDKAQPAEQAGLAEEAEAAKPAGDDSVAKIPKMAANSPCPAPAARVRMTVSSGFYVRSFCHDLGVAVGSLALMENLVRNRQSCFELERDAIDYEDFGKGEEVWGPQVAKAFREWPERSMSLGF